MDFVTPEIKVSWTGLKVAKIPCAPRVKRKVRTGIRRRLKTELRLGLGLRALGAQLEVKLVLAEK